MANIDVTFKRYNGASNDLLLPTTHLGQLYTDDTLATTLSSWLSSSFLASSLKGNVNGLAELDANGKIPYSQIPEDLKTGLKFAGLTQATNLSALTAILEGASFRNYEATSSNYYDFVGYYFVNNSVGTLSIGESTTEGTWDDFYEEGSLLDGTMSLEQGDWIIVTGWDSTWSCLKYGVINQTYMNATTSVAGIVKITNAANVGDLANGDLAVITENFLYDNIVADNSDLSGTTNTNKIAPAAHHHGGLYYTETEIQSFFSGSTGITGYNKANWDSAYTDVQNALFTDTQFGGDVSGPYNAIVVANDSHTHDTRYYTEQEVDTWLSDGDGGLGLGATGVKFVPIVYGATPSSTIEGALLIDVD